MMRGQVIQSFQANCGGALLAIVSGLVAPWLLVSGLLGRWFFRPPSEKIVLVIALTIIFVTLVDWGIRVST